MFLERLLTQHLLLVMLALRTLEYVLQVDEVVHHPNKLSNMPRGCPKKTPVRCTACARLPLKKAAVTPENRRLLTLGKAAVTLADKRLLTLRKAVVTPADGGLLTLGKPL